jgi:catechol 2,3-dioxygenase-like lactoylglutathione lyase family enzyme
MRETGGRGRWSNALDDFAGVLAAEPGPVVVSLDWGFHAPLRLLAPELDLEEPVWKLRRRAPPRTARTIEGTTRHVYLVPEPRWAMFGFGDSLLEATSRLPEGSVRVRIHRDRRGEPVFRSLRFARPHRLVYRDGFEVKLMSAIEIRGLDHVVLRVADLERSLRFYRDVLGCPEERRIQELGLVQLRAGAALIDLVPVDSPLGRPGGPAPGDAGRNVEHFAVQLARFDEGAIRAHLEACGVDAGDVAERYGALGMGPSLYIRDPDGNVVELKGAHPA